mmetsp:Transcript_30855/g.37861  ORF Transcript_30855/g.37861 Transcript_30855/m.37861 type:complete len:207 (+) Transcript_30855:222-842(+)
MGVDHGLISGVRVRSGIHHAFSLIHCCTKCNHFRLDLVAKVSGFVGQRCWLGQVHRLQLFQLLSNRFISGFAIASQLLHACLEPVQVLGTSRQNALLGHLHHGLHLTAKAGNIVLIHHLLAGFGLFCRVNLQVLKELFVLVTVPMCHSLWCGVEVRQTSLCCFHWPLRRITVAGEDHMFVLLEDLSNSITVAHASFNQSCKVSHTR